MLATYHDLALIPNADPKTAAAEVRRCAKLGLRGGDLAFKGMGLPLWHHDWDALWQASAECKFPVSFHSTGFKAVRAPDNPESREYFNSMHKAGAPKRTDIVTWFDLLDLDDYVSFGGKA